MRQTITWLMLLCLSLLMGGCGGNGGNSSPPSSANRLTYTGITSQAVITAENAEELALGAFQGEQSVMTASAQTVSLNLGGAALPVRSFARLLRRELLQQPPPMATAKATQLAVLEQPRLYPGTCGGRLLKSQNGDLATGTFSDTLDYQNYCVEGVTLNGQVAVVGTFDPVTRVINSKTMAFHPLKIQEGETVYTLDGHVRIARGGPQYDETDAMDFLLRDDSSGEVFRFENYLDGINYGPDYTEETISGRYFHPAYGYVDVSTEAPLKTTSELSLPSTGTLRCSGSDGTFVRIAYSTAISAHLEADTNGDGICEWQKDLSFPPPPDYTPVNHPPVADAGADQNAFQGELVTLDGSASFDPDGDSLNFHWFFTACTWGCPELNNAQSATPSFTAMFPGNYRLELNINDGHFSSGTDIMQVTIAPAQATDPNLLAQEWFHGNFGYSIGLTGLSVMDLENDHALEIVTAASYHGNPYGDYWYVLRRDDQGGYEQIHLSELSPVRIKKILTADLIGDGGGEILVGFEDGRVEIFSGESFLRRISIITPGVLKALAAADLDGDGRAEILTSDGQKIYIYDADGALLWSTMAYGGEDLIVGNVDDDPALEIVTSSAGWHGYVIDAAARALEWDYLNGFGSQLAIGDTDGDGRDEIVGAEYRGRITLFDAEIRSPQRELAAYPDQEALLVTDLDGDGVAEILYGDSQWGSIHCYEGDGTTERWAIAKPEFDTVGLAVGDVDGDGTTEVLWGSQDSAGTDLLFVADPVDGIEWQNPHSGSMSTFAVGDVDDDGSEEIVIVRGGYYESALNIFDAATLEWQSSEMSGIFPSAAINALRFADIDGDGETELVFTTSNSPDGGIQVYNGRTHLLEQQSTANPGLGFTALEIADIDGDRAMEVIAGTISVANEPHLVILEGATLTEKWRSTSLATWGGISDIDIADVDDDGRVEVLVALEAGKVYAIDGVTHQYDWLAALPASTVGAFDLDADGRKEILVGQNDGTIGVYEGAGFIFQRTVSPLFAGAVAALNLEDLDGDGIPEWLVAGGGTLSVMENGSDQLLWRSKPLSGNLGRYNLLPVKDIDNDGKKEILIGSDFAVYQFD